MEATGIAAQGAPAASKLQDSARALRGAAEYLRGGLGTCTGPEPQRELDGIASDLEVLACRARVADVTGRPEILHSPTDEVFYRQLLDIEEERGHDAAALQTVAACLSTLASVRSTLAARLRQHGLAGEQHRVADEDFSAVAAACAGSSTPAQHLARMAREKTSDANEWRTALGLAQKALSPECAKAAGALVGKIEGSACRGLYRSVLSAHGRERKNMRGESNASLAREVVVLLESSGHGAHLDDPTLARCILAHDAEIGGPVRARLRAALPVPSETGARLDAFELSTRGAIARKQGELAAACAPQASSALLRPLLGKDGRVELLEVMRAVPEVEALLARPTENETVKQESARRRCAHKVQDFELDVRQRLCRLRLLRRLHLEPRTGDPALTRHWLHKDERGDFVADEHREVDQLCVHTLDAEGAKIRQRAALLSARTCPDGKIKAVLEHFCSEMAAASVPVNFLDFLSLLLLSALPRWPTSSVSMRKWLAERRRGAGGDALACAATKEIIQIHGLEPGRESKGHGALRRAVVSVLASLESGVELEALAKCACSSAGVLASDTRRSLARSTKWYWEAGSAIMAQGQQDSHFVTEARQKIVTEALAALLRHVSWSGRASLKRPAPPVLKVLWESYLRQMISGPLSIFWNRIKARHRDAQCQLAMVDTFFFVVALDLVDVSSRPSVSQDAYISNVAARMSLTKSGVAQAALAVAAAAGLAGVAVGSTGLGAALGTTAIGAAKAAAKFGVGTAGVAFAQKVGQEVYRRHLEPQSFTSRFAKAAPEKDGILSSAYRQLFSTIFSRKNAVTEVLLQLCSRAMEESAAFGRGEDEPGEVTESRVKVWESLNATWAVKPEPPLYFPLAPPGGGLPPPNCSNELC